ncbi:RNase H domain-containing protein [Trichonephila clavipes]|nr:RNase H domain-containing protein [Trichonephila clavipes]
MKLERGINLVLEDIRNFALDHKLTFNHTKSVVSFFTQPIENFIISNLIFFLYNQPLTIDKHPKYLGFVLDSEILGNKHIDNIVFKARKRLNILRYISGRDWGADAGTLRNTYISLIRPILEYGIPVYCSASVTNLQKLEKVQFSAAWIITGLKDTCPRDIVLFEAGLQPVSPWRRACLTKYYNKLVLQLTSKIADDLDRVFLHPELPVHVNKQADLPAYLKQLALERRGDIPIDVVQVYTDGSRDDNYRSGSGIYIKSLSGSRFYTRQDQTLLAHFRSGHIKSMKFSEGRKSFEMCTNCSSVPATPAHILECLGLTKQDLADVPLLVLDFLKVYDVMDLV